MYTKKSLGQHFLHPNYARQVADAAQLVPGEQVLEVGPGRGVLTRELLARGARVTAIEKDRRLIPLLQETFAEDIGAKRLRVVEGDALAFDLPSLKFREYIVVANIPYYITGALLRKFFSEESLPSKVVLLTQKEVAERIARSTKESVLSLSIKAYGAPEYVKTVPRGAFSPAPGVDSAILRITAISRNVFASAAHEKRFFVLLHAGFAQKRKLLRRNLEVVFGERAAQLMQSAGIPLSARAEDIPLPQWLALARV